MKYINEENDGEFVDVDAIVAQIDYETDEGIEDSLTETHSENAH